MLEVAKQMKEGVIKLDTCLKGDNGYLLNTTDHQELYRCNDNVICGITKLGNETRT